VIYKRGKVYWYEFRFKGKRIQKSTMQKNADKARDAESVARTRLVNGVLGIERQQAKVVPTLESFKTTFMVWVRSALENQRSQGFYETCYERLCEFKPLGKATLDQIDEDIIENFKLHALENVSQTTVNRYLMTLKKALRYACRERKLIGQIPVIKLYPDERVSEFVYPAAAYQAWLQSAHEPLRSASILAHDSGICRGEMLALQKDCVHLLDRPDARGFWGTIDIIRGLKRKARRRVLCITENMGVVLIKLVAESRCEYVFTSLRDHGKPLSMNTLANQHRAIKKTCTFDPDAGLHALRHTFLTAAGKHTQNVKALMLLAGHSRIETTMRYIHPDQDDVMDIASAVQQARERIKSPDALEVPTISPTMGSGQEVTIRKQ
jgi:integrase